MSELNTMQFGEHTAVIAYDPEVGMFRGEFVNLNGGADFYGASVDELRQEGQQSLQAFLDVCKEQGLDPVKRAPASFPLRLDDRIYHAARVVAAARDVSLNQLIARVLEKEVTKHGVVHVKSVKTASKSKVRLAGALTYTHRKPGDALQKRKAVRKHSS